MSFYERTDVVCMIEYPDPNNELGFRFIDVGNYYKDANGNVVAILDIEDAKKYARFINAPVMVKKGK